MTTDLDQKSAGGLSRRSVVRGAAWSVPVVSMAATAPAFAASPCGTVYTTWKLDWGTTPYTKASANFGSATVGNVAGTVPIVVSFTSSVTSGITRDPGNLDLEDGVNNIGNLGANEQGLELWHSASVNNDARYQQVIIGFDRTVSDLKFTITDIDFNQDQYSDRVSLSGDRSFALTTDTVITGAGTNTNPWRPRNTNPVTLANSGDRRGNVAVSYRTPVDSITLRYWNGGGSGQQAIWISDMTFSAAGC